LFIVNPISGTEKKELILSEIERMMDKTRFSWEVKKTEYRGHGAVLATMAAENGVDMVVAIGGDGTVNEVARSLVHTDTVMGIIPCGSGNGLARHLNIPLNHRKAIEIINTFNIRTVDYGIINHHPFFCTCGMGFDAVISHQFASSIKRGILTYLENTLKEITRYQPETYTIEDESGKLTRKAFLITCANASQYGNNVYIAPKASMSDGLMDVTIVEPFTALETPQLAYQLLNGTLKDKGRIKMFRSKKLHITRQHPGFIHCDGDPMLADKDITVEIIPKMLKVASPKKTRLRKSTILQTITETLNTFVTKELRNIQP